MYKHDVFTSDHYIYQYCVQAEVNHLCGITEQVTGMHINCIVLSHLLHTTHTYLPHKMHTYLSQTKPQYYHPEHITDDGVWLDCLHQMTSSMGIDVTLVLYTFKVPLDFLLIMFILLSPKKKSICINQLISLISTVYGFCH